MILSFTGHRTLDNFSMDERRHMYKTAYDFLFDLREERPIIIQGMALGWDMAVGFAGINLGL